MTTVNLATLVRSAHVDPPGAQGYCSAKSNTLPVEQELAKLGYLDPKYADGSFGTLTIAAYARWQTHLGYKGNDADGIPGLQSLTALGKLGGFSVIDGGAPQSTSGPGGGPRESAIGLYDVTFNPRIPDFSCTAVIKAVCAERGLPTTWWLPGGLTVASRESSYRRDAINTTDLNAHGPIVADGHPLYCSRGAWQFIAPTFAAHHHPGTSNNIYDGPAQFHAFINYTMDNYGVAADGHNLAARVQQADPHRPPRGY